MGLSPSETQPASPRPCPEQSEEGFVGLFDGKTLDGWQGDTENYIAEEGKLVCKEGHSRRLYTAKEYGDFQFRFEFRHLRIKELEPPLPGVLIGPKRDWPTGELRIPVVANPCPQCT